MTTAILNMDSVEALKTLADNSIQLFVTSPPYGALRSYDGHCKWDFENTAIEIARVLDDGGVCCWNVGDETINGSERLEPFRQALFFTERAGLRMHDRMIWYKNNFSNPSFNRYHQVFEDVFIFSKCKPRCFNPIKDKANAQAGMVGTIGKNSYQKRDGERTTRTSYITQDFGMRGNVWKGNTAGQENMGKSVPHPAMMPKWLARDLILSWSNPGDSIGDCFAGSGTVGREAIELGRNAWLNDINPDYAELCKQSCNTTAGFQLVT